MTLPKKVIILPHTNERSAKMEGLYSKIVKAGSRTYFVDVRVARGGEKYLAITETRPGAERTTFTRSKVVVLSEFIPEIKEAFGEAVAIIERGGA